MVPAALTHVRYIFIVKRPEQSGIQPSSDDQLSSQKCGHLILNGWAVQHLWLPDQGLVLIQPVVQIVIRA